MKLIELLGKYQAKRLRGKSIRTVKLYLHSIKSFGRTIGTIPTIEHLNDETIIEHMHSVTDRGGAPESANKDRSQLLALWRFAIQEKIVDRWPSVPMLIEPERVPLGWLPGEVARLLLAISQLNGSIRIETALPKQRLCEVPSIPERLFFDPLVRLCIDSGERIGAIRGLPRSAFQESQILVPACLRKGKRREMLYSLQPETTAAIKRLLKAHNSKLIFPYGYSETYLYRQYNQILERAGLPTDRRSKFHRIRRTVASAVARAGGDATKALDHASPKTTRKYLDPRIVGGVDVSSILASYLSDPNFRANHKASKIPKSSAG